MIFRASPLKNLLLLVGCAAFVAIGVIIRDKEPWIGWANIIFFGSGVLVSLIRFHPRASGLILDQEGFEVRGLFRGQRTNWSDIKNIRAGRIAGNKMIFFDYEKGHDKWRGGKRLARYLSGAEGAIRSTYSIKCHELVELMKEYKSRSKDGST